MTEPVPPKKLDPETLVLRGQPRRAVRFKRNVLIGAAALACTALAGITWLGLQPPSARTATPTAELYNPDKAADGQKPKPAQWQHLPASYSETSGAVPVLGPPLPGDLGHVMLENQRASGQGATTSSEAPPATATGQAGLFFQVRPAIAPIAAAAFASLSEDGLPPTSEPFRTEPAEDPNAQGRKQSFITAKSDTSIYNSHTLQTPASPYQVMAGTVIPATLITGLNSDLPGMVIAQVTEGVRDTVSGRFLLIPQGTRLIGTYDSVVAFGQSRALLIWKRMILPNGTSMEIDNLPATDEGGYAGLTDKIDRHTWTVLKGVGLSTLLGVTAIDGSSDDSDLVKALRDSTRQSANQVGQKIIDRSLNVQPSLTVRPGWPLRVIVHKDLILQPYAQEVSQWPN